MPLALPALEAVDLLALAAVFLLIGLLIAVRYSFTRLAQVLDVGIAGYHPFAGISSAIENVVIAGVNEGIGSLEHVAVTLWHWSSVAIAETVAGITAFIHDAAKSIAWLRSTGIPAAIHAVTDPLTRTAHEAEQLALQDAQDIAAEVHARAAAIEHASAATLETVARELHALQRTIEGEALSAFPHLAADVNHLVDEARAAVEHEAGLTASTLAGAAEQALTNTEALAGATAADLRGLLGKLSPTDVAALIAAVPLLHAAITTLEAETGLDNPGCRTKIKGVCGTNPSQWLHFLEGLAFTLEWPGLTDFADAVAAVVPEVEDAVMALVGG